MSIVPACFGTTVLGSWVDLDDRQQQTRNPRALSLSPPLKTRHMDHLPNLKRLDVSYYALQAVGTPFRETQGTAAVSIPKRPTIAHPPRGVHVRGQARPLPAHHARVPLSSLFAVQVQPPEKSNTSTHGSREKACGDGLRNTKLWRLTEGNGRGGG